MIFLLDWSPNWAKKTSLSSSFKGIFFLYFKITSQDRWRSHKPCRPAAIYSTGRHNGRRRQGWLPWQPSLAVSGCPRLSNKFGVGRACRGCLRQFTQLRFDISRISASVAKFKHRAVIIIQTLTRSIRLYGISSSSNIPNFIKWLRQSSHKLSTIAALARHCYAILSCNLRGKILASLFCNHGRVSRRRVLYKISSLVK